MILMMMIMIVKIVMNMMMTKIMSRMMMAMKIKLMMTMMVKVRMMILDIHNKKPRHGILERWLCSRRMLVTNRDANNDCHGNDDVIDISPVLDDTFVISVRLKHDGVRSHKQHTSDNIILHSNRQNI